MTKKNDESTIRTIEELSMNSWPSLQTMFMDGWILRISGSYSKRANLVIPLYPSRLDDMNEKIRECEKYYFERNLDSVFKMTRVSEPAGLDSILSAMGYQYQGETSVQVMDLHNEEKLEGETVQTTLQQDASDDWFASFCEMNNIAVKKQLIARETLAKTIPTKSFASISNDQGKIIACGLAVSQKGYVGLFDIVTRKEYRRRGVALKLTRALLRWGGTAGSRFSFFASSGR